jgi:hypothetical protein
MTTALSFKSALPWLGGLALACAAAPVFAQAPAQALHDDSFVVNLGTFILSTDLRANLNGQSTQNPEVNFDETFGRDNNATRGRADVLWRINPAHHLRFMYFDNKSEATRALSQPIKWGDYTFQAGSVKSERNFSTSMLAYEYAFVRQPSYDVAASFGVHYTKMDIKLSGNATIVDSNGNTVAVNGASQSNSVPVPLPMIGIRAGWVVSPNWYLDAQGQFFKLNYNDIDGHWSDLRANATWMFSRHFGLGLGYNIFTNKINVSKNNTFDGSVRFGYSGFQAFLTGSF